MQVVPLMDPPADTELSNEDSAVIIRNLDAAIAILDQNVGRRSLAEVKVRSMIAVLRVEVAGKGRMENTQPPFGFARNSRSPQ